jgi:hypothetical protein
VKLLVTVDTEEEGLWGGEFRRSGNTVDNVRGVERFQELCDEFEVRPTYLVDTPVVESDEAVRRLKSILDRNGCEIGAHLHPWCAPPYEEEVSPRNSFTCNLPESLQRAKLSRLTLDIEERFGVRPTSFRAGRYGLDIVGAKILLELGYLVDSSVISFMDYTGEGGPSFVDAPFAPYFVGDESLIREGTGPLLEVPVSVGYSRGDFQRAHRWRELAASRPLRSLRLVGVLDRLDLVRRIKFSPEQADASRMNRLIEAFAGHQAPCVVMLLHSSSLAPGYSPYVRDERQLERLYVNLRATFEYARRRGLTSDTLSGFAETYKTAACPN